uniref:KAP P-loop domain protein n=1 Tax=Marinomonas sp. (strain MWYL1) TaxID=400668 RepID=A6W218_MARMS
MPTNEPFTDIELQRLEDRLEKLDQKAIITFAERCAFRVFPLLAERNKEATYFYYWLDADKTRYLLSVWHTLLLNRGPSSLANLTAANTNSFSSFQAANTIQTVYAAANVRSSMKVRNAAHKAAFNNASNAIIAAADSDYFPDIKTELESDLAQLENGKLSTLTSSPLWKKPNSDYINWLEKHLPDALNQLSSEQDKRLTSSILNNIWPIYKSIFDGKPNQKAIDNALDQLEEFFSNKNIDETENNKLHYGKDDEPFYGENDELIHKNENEPNSEADPAPKPEETEHDIETIAGNRHSSHQYAVEDKLNRQHLVNTLAALLQNQNNHHHQTIGLLGHWGVGKTSVVELLKIALQKKEEKTSIVKQLKYALVHCHTIGLLKYCSVIKSSIAKQLKTTFQAKKHRGKPKFLFAEFNAWEYEHTDNLQAGIAQEMIKALSSPLTYTKSDKKWINKIIHWLKISWKQVYWCLIQKPWLILRFALSLHGFKVLIPLSCFIIAFAPFWLPDVLKTAFKSFFDIKNTGITSTFPYAWLIGFLYPAIKNTKALFAGPLAKELLTYLKLPDYGKHLGTIPVMREHIKKLTKVRLGNKRRLLYVVDDLDRCGHKGIVKVLEAVRMVLDLDNVIVVIAVDQRIALAALALNYKELATQHHIEDPRLIARDYLAKIIHLPIVLTEPDEASVSSYLANLWDETSSPESKALAEKSGTVLQEDSRFIKNNTNNTDEAKQTDGNGQEAKTKKEGNVTRQNTEKNNTKTSETDSPIEKNETVAPTKDIKQIEQLTEPQKHAFTYWLKHFELSNPRQIKRLNNSFNLLRNFYSGEDKEPVEATTEEAGSEHAFPMMVTLFAFEYLNNLDDIKKRQKLKKLINKESNDLTEKEEAYLTDYKITPLVIELANLSLKNTTMILGIEPFVLPGIDMIDKTAEKTESR